MSAVFSPPLGRSEAITTDLIDSLLVHQNPNLKERYYRATRNALFNALLSPIGKSPDSPYADFWWDLTKREEASAGFAKLAQRMESGTLIDLGGGERAMEETMKLAKLLKIARYINVDFFFERHDKHIPNHRPENIELPITEIAVPNGLDAHLIRADMLTFIAQLPPDSFHFTVNGIDFIAVRDNDYHRALAEEIARATVPGGICFGKSSDCFEHCSAAGLNDITDQIFADFPADQRNRFELHVFEKQPT